MNFFIFWKFGINTTVLKLGICTRINISTHCTEIVLDIFNSEKFKFLFDQNHHRCGFCNQILTILIYLRRGRGISDEMKGNSN